MKTIGTQFASELRTAGLFGLPFSWQEDGVINFNEAMTPAQIAAVNAVYAAHDPLKVDFASLKAAEDAKWKAIREQYAGRLASIASRLYTSDPASSASCDAVATSLLGLFTEPAVIAATDIAAYKLALKARYKQATLLATGAALAEFGRYDR